MVAVNTIIKIEPIWFQQIVKYLGYPKIESVVLNDEEIKSICLFPAMNDYFNQWPIRVREQFDISGNGGQTFDFPDNDTFGVLSVKPVAKSDRSSNKTSGSDFWRVVYFQQSTAGSVGSRSGRRGGNRNRKIYTNNGLQFDYLNQEQLNDSLLNRETFRPIIDYNDRQVSFFSSIPCQLAITWIKHSKNFDANVRYSQKLNVCKLAASNALDHLADMGGMMADDTTDKNFDVDQLRSRAEGLRSEVIDVWNERPTLFIGRGS